MRGAKNGGPGEGTAAVQRTPTTDQLIVPGNTQEKLDAALAYAAADWPVHPLIPGGKMPATAHGVKDATTDPDKIRRWWTDMPDANLAIATGAPGPDVLDVDKTETGDGFAAMDQLKRVGLLCGALRVVHTPRGGRHIYFSGTEQGNRAHIGGHPLDFRGHGGYVVAPPSVVDGKPYVLADARTEGSTLNMAAVVELLMPPRTPRSRRAKSSRRGGLAGLVKHVAGMPEHNRNSALYWAACRAVDEDHADQLDDLVVAAVKAGLRERDARATVNSAARRLGGAA